MTTDLLTCLAAIPDRRRAEGKMYGQVGVILFSILAMVSGARSYRQIHTLIDRRLGLLNAAFPGAALRRAPAYTSVRGILQGLEEAELEQAFRRHAEALDHTCTASPSRFVAIDGKTLRGSFDAFADRKAAHVLSAFAVDHRIILAHEVVAETSNEIPAVQTLIETLGLTGRVFTIDAMHCQKNLRDCQGDRQRPHRTSQGEPVEPAALPRRSRHNGTAPRNRPPPRPRPQPAGRPSCRGLRPSRRAVRHRMGSPHRGPRARSPAHPNPLRRNRSLDGSRGNRPLRFFGYAARCNLRERHPEPLGH